MSRSHLPAWGTIDQSARQTRLVYVDSGLRRRLQIYPDRRPGLLAWQVDVDVPNLGRPGTADFDTRYTLPREVVARDGRLTQRYGSGYGWPVGASELDPRLVDDVARFAPAMLWFLNDRHELGRLLLAGRGDDPSPWHRNGITASRWSGAAAGVVQALILARILSDTELEALAFAKIGREHRHVVAGSGGRTFPQEVGYWAEQMRQHTPIDISDLLELMKPPASPRR